MNHCEQIFTVPGIGWAEMGPGDMHMSMGLIRDGHDHEEVEKARKRVNAACEKNGVKFLGGVHGGEDKVGALKKVIDSGARIISAVLQSILNIVDFEMNLEEATYAKRIHHQC